MSLPAIDPANLPTIPLNVRRWIYAVFIVLVVAANGIDVYFDNGDPAWLPGVLRVLNMLGIVVGSVALLNARPTPAETVDDYTTD